MHIYRYKYLKDGEGLRAVIRDRTMRFTHPQEFNDPFDCMPAFEVRMSRDIEKIHQKFRNVLNLDSLDSSERDRTLLRVEDQMRLAFASGEFLSNMLSGCSVLSLTKIPDSTLMWSHYAKDHKGAVVEFKIDVSKRPFSIDTSYADFICQDIIYSKERPVMVFDGSSADPGTILDELILTKADVWSYEQESRVVKSSGGGGNLKYNDSLLNAVILGARNESADEIRELVFSVGSELQRDIPVYQAQFCNRTYRLDIPGFQYRYECGDIQSAHPLDR